MKKETNRKGFTLVELMVVVAIMGVLVAVAVPAYNNATAGAEAATCAANARTYESSLLQWQIEDISKRAGQVPDPSDTTGETLLTITAVDDVDGNGVDGLSRYIKGGVVMCPSDPAVSYIFHVSGEDIYVVCAGDGNSKSAKHHDAQIEKIDGATE